MAENKIFLDVFEGIARVITTTAGRIAACAFDVAAKPMRSGAVYMGQVDRMLAGARGAFIKIGENETGFLNDAEGLAAGQRLFVQIKGDARDDKGPLLTQNISLPGIYFIHQPFGGGVHTSRRADGANTRHVEDLLAGKNGGWVIRSAAAHASKEILLAEMQNLLTASEKLQGNSASAPCLPAPSVFEQALLAALGEGPVTVVAEQGVDIAAHTRYLRMVLPQLLGALSIQNVKGAFEEGDLNGFYHSLCQKMVPLPNGGNVLFERTEAMHVVDVNGASRTHFLDVNCEAVEIIANHIRWRNLGGLLVIDFLKMRRPEDRHEVADTLRELMEDDHLPVDVYGFTRMGLCEISRAKRGYSLDEVRGLRQEAVK